MICLGYSWNGRKSIVVCARRNVCIYKRIGEMIYVYLIEDTKTEYTRTFRDMIIDDPRIVLQEKTPMPDGSPESADNGFRQNRAEGSD